MLKLRNVSKRYDKKDILSDISFSLSSYGLYAISGKSGSGKSTLLNIIFGADKPSSGEVLFFGKNISKLTNKEKCVFRSTYCSFLYQHFNLLEDHTAFENVLLPLRIKGMKDNDSFAEVEALFKDYSLEYLKDKKVSLLSGGEKQRIAFLRAIVNKPKLLLADEPTGALDKENEETIMQYFKKISKNTLVIFVTHNEKLISKYSDGSLVLEDGKIQSNFEKYSLEDNQPFEEKKRTSSSWVLSLTKSNYRKNIFKNIFSIVSGTLGYLSILASIGFYNGSQKLLERNRNESLSYLNATISKRSTYKVDGTPLSLSRAERPSIEESEEYLKDYPSIKYKNDYSYFLPTYHSFKLNGFSYGATNLTAIEDITLKNRNRNFLIQGEAPTGDSLNYCLVNDQFLRNIDKDAIGKTIRIQNEVSLQKEKEYETVSIDFSMRVVGVVKEFSFLSSPKIYYSYPAFESYLLRRYLPKFSFSLKEFLDEEEYHSKYFSYSLNLFLSEDDARRLEKDDTLSEDLDISSMAFEINSSFQNIYRSFSSALMPFLILEIFGVAFVIFSFAYHSFLQRRKELAILSSLGAADKDLRKISQLEQMLNGFLNAIASLLLSIPLEFLLSNLLEKKIGLPSLILIPYSSFLGIPFLIVLITFLFSFAIAFFGSSLPFLITRKRNLLEELRDE